MASVNELGEEWFQVTLNIPSGHYVEALDDCRRALDETAREAWRPVSEPPTADDGDMRGEVVVYHPGVGSGKLTVAQVTEKKSGRAMWARTRDVILFPPEGEG